MEEAYLDHPTTAHRGRSKSQEATPTQSHLVVAGPNRSSNFGKLPTAIIGRILTFFLNDEHSTDKDNLDLLPVVDVSRCGGASATYNGYTTQVILDGFLRTANCFIEAIAVNDYLWKQMKPHGDAFHYQSSDSVVPARINRLLCCRLEHDNWLVCDASLQDALALIISKVPVSSLKVWLPIAQLNRFRKLGTLSAVPSLLFIAAHVGDVRIMYASPRLLQSIGEQVSCFSDNKSVSRHTDPGALCLNRDTALLASITELSLVEERHGETLKLSSPLIGLEKLEMNAVYSATTDYELRVFFEHTPNLRHLNMA